MKNIVIIGCGFMGGIHGQAYRKIRRANIAALVDSNAGLAGSLAGSLGGGIPIFASLGEALGSVAADAVDICLPTPAHEPVALEVIGRGKAVFIEKPIANDLASANKIVRAARKAGVAAQVGHCIRFWPEYQALEAAVRTGRLGRLLSLSLQRRSPAPKQSGWMLNPAMSGGAATDLHIHDTDYILHLLGRPSAVTSSGTSENGGISHIFTTYHYPETAVVAEGGWNYPAAWEFRMAYQAVFERGAIEFDSAGGLLITSGTGARRPLPFKKPAIGNATGGTGNISALGGYFNELAYFVACLESGRMPELSTPEQATETLAVVLAEIRSARTGQRVAIPSQAPRS